MTPSTNPKLIDDGRFYIVRNEESTPLRLASGSLYVRHLFEKDDSQITLIGTYRYIANRQWKVTIAPVSDDHSSMSMGEYGSMLSALTILWQYRKTFDLSSLFS